MKRFVFVMSMVLVFIDQLLKNIVLRSMNLYDSIQLIPNFLSITYVENDGGAFGILSGGRWFFIILGIIVLFVFLRFVMLDSKISKFDRCAYSLVISGIIGNLIDRIFYGKVIDYIDFHLFEIGTPIFNFADICIVFGAFMIIYILLVKGDSDGNIYSRK